MHLLQRILVALAWLVVTAALFLLAVEESGVLNDLVRSRLAWRLGSLAPGLSIERVSLRWFEPGLVLEDVRLKVPAGTDSGGEPEEELLHLRRTNVSLGLEEGELVGRLHVQGGRIRISDRLLAAIESVAASLSRTRRGEMRSPPCSLSDIDVDLELPGGTPFQLGRASILALPDETGRYRLRGSVTPVLGGLVASPVEIHVDGRQQKDGLTIRTAAQGLALQSRGLARQPELAGLSVDELSGELTLEASARLDWSGERLHTTGELRARLGQGRLIPKSGEPLFEALTCDVDLSFDVSAGERLWNRDLWSARARLEAEWLGSPFVAWGVLGRDLPAGTWAHAWAHFPELAFDERILDALGADARRRELWRSLAPRGSVPTTIDARFAPPHLEGGRPVWTAPDLALALHPDGRMGVTYVGEPDPHGRPRGIPIPVERMRGEAFLASWSAPAHTSRLALDVEGEQPSGSVRAAGISWSPEHPGEAAGLDLDLTCDSLAVDERLRAGLAGHYSTAGIWQDFQPRGGQLSFAWRLYEDAATRGLTASGDILLQGVSCAWRELPIPFEDAMGELHLRWARRSAWATPDRLQSVRPFGLSYRFSNEASPAKKLARASVAGFVRDDFTTIEGPGAVPLHKTQQIDVDIDELLLRGRDFEALAGRFPAVVQPIEELGAKGGVRVRFEGRRASPSAPYRTAIEISPTQAELTPRSFQRRTQDLRGRCLVTTAELATGATGETRLALSGAWTGGEELACQGELFSGLPSRLLVHGAGIDPSNTGFRGALFRAMGAGEGGGGDMAESAIQGRIDFTVESEIVPSSEIAPSNRYRVYLRGNAFENGSLRLEDLQGVLMQSGELLGSPRLGAALAGHPLELRDVRVFRLADAARLAIADPILQRPTFWSDPQGYALQAELHVADLPLDEAHLASLLSAQALAAFRESEDWRGALDVDGAQVVVTSEHGRQGKVAVRGGVVPHDLALRFGVPIDVPRASVDIEELIFESGSVRGWGRVLELDASILDRRLSEARMLFSYVDGRLSIDNLDGAFAGGRLVSLGGAGQGTRKALAFDLAPPYHFDLALKLENAQVASLLEDVFQSSIADVGVIDAGLRLRGTPRHVLGIAGGGWFELNEGRLWSIPVMREVFQQLGSDNTAVFDRMRAHFTVKDGRIQTTDVRVRSALVNLVGSGWIDLDGTLSYDLEARYSLLDRLGPLNRILYWLNNSLWRVAVRGDMARPRVSIRNALLEFLSGFDEHPMRELPLPDYAPFPVRF